MRREEEHHFHRHWIASEFVVRVVPLIALYTSNAHNEIRKRRIMGLLFLQIFRRLQFKVQLLLLKMA